MIPSMAVVHHRHAQRSNLGRRVLIVSAVLMAALILGVPTAIIFTHAFAKGFDTWWRAISSTEALQAIGLSLLTLAIVVPVNAVYGLSVAWAVTKFRWRGKKWVVSLIEIPFSVSPIVAGVAYLMVYGSSGLLGEWLMEHDIKIMFAVPGIVLATLFVTSPFVAREVMPLMHLQGTDEEEAAQVLGAGGLRTFLAVTLPNVKWALLYGLILCAARSLGEFGAVSVVSGHIRGETNTLPLYIDLLYHDYENSGAFAAASVLTLLALVTVVLKAVVESRRDAVLDERSKKPA
jgi:sulfate ABC transporter, permease protein CysW